MIWGVLPASPDSDSKAPPPGAAPLTSAELEAIRPALRRSAAAVLRRSNDVEDAVQEAMLRIVRHAQRGSIERNTLIALGCTTARRVALDMLARRTPIAAGNIGELAEQPVVDPGQTLDAAHVKGRLRHAVEALPDGQRIAFLLVFQEGLSHPDAARELRISSETLRARLFRARCHLRTALKDLRP